MTQIEIFNYKQKTWRKTHIREFDVTTLPNFNILGTLNPCHNYSKHLSHCFLYAVTTFSTPAILRKEKKKFPHYHHCTLLCIWTIKVSAPNAANVVSARNASVVVRLTTTPQKMQKSATSACCHRPILDPRCKIFSRSSRCT